MCILWVSTKKKNLVKLVNEGYKTHPFKSWILTRKPKVIIIGANMTWQRPRHKQNDTSINFFFAAGDSGDIWYNVCGWHCAQHVHCQVCGH